MFLKHTLDALKTQLDNNKLKVISHQGEIQTVGFNFNIPLDYNFLKKVKLNKNWYLPDDYETFLLEHNGAKLFELYLGNTNIGGGLLLYSLEEIQKVQQNLGMDNDYYPIGYVHEEHLMIKNSKENNKNYLYFGHLEKRPTNMNFELFLDRFIVSNGSNFWDWPRLDAESYYKYF